MGSCWSEMKIFSLIIIILYIFFHLPKCFCEWRWFGLNKVLVNKHREIFIKKLLTSSEKRRGKIFFLIYRALSIFYKSTRAAPKSRWYISIMSKHLFYDTSHSFSPLSVLLIYIFRMSSNGCNWTRKRIWSWMKMNDWIKRYTIYLFSFSPTA